MPDKRRSTDSELITSATYRIAQVLGEAPIVPVAFKDGIEGYRCGYRFTAQALGANNEQVTLGDDEASDVTDIWLWQLYITCQKRAPRSLLDPDEAVEITGLIARDIKTAIILRIPKMGFPGETPRRENIDVTIDGERAKLDAVRHYDPNIVTLFPAPGNEITLDELTTAASGQSPPSRARMMAAEAGYQAFFNSSASDVTAVVVAASACEIAIHACVRHLSSGHSQRLIEKLLPKDSQAKLSPKDLIDGVIPLLTGRRLADEYPNLWGSIKELFSARDKGVHQGVLPEGAHAPMLVQQARKFVRWAEELDVDSS